MARKQSKLKQLGFFSILKDKRITLKAYYAMVSLYAGESIEIDKDTFQLLSTNNLISESELTEKAEETIMVVERLFRGQSTLTDSQLMGDDFKANILKYRSIFPKMMLKSGKPAWSSPGNLTKAFRWFFLNYDYSWDVIFRATAHYIRREHNGESQYCRTSQYFIRKNDNSDLANVCEEIQSGLMQAPIPVRKIKVV